MSQPEAYASITGLQVWRVWYIPAFWTHAIRAMVQARRAPGNISAEAHSIDGVHHTLTVCSPDLRFSCHTCEDVAGFTRA